MPGGCGTKWHTLDSRQTNKQADGQLTADWQTPVFRGQQTDGQMNQQTADHSQLCVEM